MIKTISIMLTLIITLLPQCPERGLQFFPRYDDYSTPLDDRSNMREPTISSSHEKDTPEVTLHRKFVSLIVEFSILFLQEEIQWHELNSYIPSTSKTLEKWLSSFSTSHPCHSSRRVWHFDILCHKDSHGEEMLCLYNDMLDALVI